MSNVNVTGMGIINSVANNTEEFKNALIEGKCGILFSKDINGYIAPIPELDFCAHMSKYKNMYPGQYKHTLELLHKEPTDVKNTVLATWEAAAMSNLMDVEDRRRVSIVIAGSNLFQSQVYSIYDKYWERSEYTNPRYAVRYMDTYIMSLISEIFKIKGEGFTVGGASASGNVAITKAKQLIDLDLADICLVIGSPTSLSTFELKAFENLGALGGKEKKVSPAEVCRPFDKKHDGFIPGQCAACIVIEKEGLRSIEKKAALCSAVSFLDGSSGSSPSLEGEIYTIKKALESAGITPGQVQYINAHGTRTPMGDEIELQAISEVFINNKACPLVNSTKSIIGHCLNSAAIAEAISVIIQTQNGFLHSNRNLENTINERVMLIEGSCKDTNIEYAVSNSFGFGGINSSIVLKKV